MMLLARCAGHAALSRGCRALPLLTGKPLLAGSCLAFRPPPPTRALCSFAGDPNLTPEAWLKAYLEGSAPPLRFPIGTPVLCYVGGSQDEWIRGTVVAQHYREESWPEGQRAPYQILLDEDGVREGKSNAIWAPADHDRLVRAGFRFKLRDEVECRVAEDEWAHCTVVGLLYREPNWPEGQHAPYQVQLHSLLPGPILPRAIAMADSANLIWLPRDSVEYIRPRSAEREERLRALEQLRMAGILDESAYAEKRRELIHDPKG